MNTDLVKEIEKQIIHTNSLFSVDKTFEDPRFMRVRIAAMHSGINRNNSRFSTETIMAAKGTFANIPILADVQEYTDEDGNKYLDYSGHSMHIEEDAFDNSVDRMIYDEKVVGIVPESNNFEIITDEETGNDYVYVDALLYREYGNYVCDILESRENKTDVSMEISCDDCSFSAKDKVLDVGTMTACAITLLGEHVAPGMAKAHAEVFSVNNTEIQNQLIKIMQELKQSLDNYTQAQALNSKEGGKNIMLETLLEKYGKTVEDITFDYSDMTDEELEAKFAELFDESDPTSEDPSPEEEGNEEENGDNSGADEGIAPAAEIDEGNPIEEEAVITTDEVKKKEEITYSIKMGEIVKEFSVSMNAKIEALSNLINDTYSDDMTWYCIEAYDEDKTVVMIDCWTGRAYRQSYKVKDDVFSLKGDRVEVYSTWMTADEQKAFDKMKADFSTISEKLEKYETEPDKMAILNSSDYSQISSSEEFVDFMKQESHFDLSIDEVKQKADDMLLNYAKTGALTFASLEENKTIEKKKIPTEKKKTSRYGNLFSK